MNYKNSAITITFSEVVENHAGMQKIGNIASDGYSIDEIADIAALCEDAGLDYDVFDLNEYVDDVEPHVQCGQAMHNAACSQAMHNAACSQAMHNAACSQAMVIVVRNAVSYLTDIDERQLFDELANVDVDKKVFMYGRVVNKHARYNVCFGDESQEPDYEAKRGTAIAFSDVPYLSKLRRRLPKLFGKRSKHVLAEGNYYYDVAKCGIGAHGDTERRIVIGLRLGASIPLCFHWYQNGKPIGEKVTLHLNSGDIYVMSSKAVGNDWRKRNIATLRHAAGSSKYTTFK